MSTIKVKNEQAAYCTGLKVDKIGVYAIRASQEEAKNWDQKMLGIERANIMYEYVRSAAFFTITLNMLSEDSISFAK